MNPPLTIRRRSLAALGMTAVLALTFLAGPGPAGAHEGGGTLTVEQVHPAGQSVHYIVLVTWDNDGHPAEDATVTATPVGPDGAALTPVTLAPSGAGDGRYSGAVEFPSAGSWTVRFTSIEPTGSAERPEQVTAATSPEAGGSGEGSGSDATSVTGEGGFAPAADGTGDSAAGDDDGDGGIPVLLVVGAAVVALGGVATALLAIRRYRPDLAEPGSAPGSGEAAPTAGAGGPEAPAGSPEAEPGPASADKDS